MKRIFFLLLLTLFAATKLEAGNGSLYARYGIGEVQYYPSAMAAGMGFVGVAVPSPLYINRLNPALLGDIRDTRLAGDFLYKSYSSSSLSNSTFQVVSGFDGIGTAIPVWQLTVSTGFYPYSRRNFEQFQIDSLTAADGAKYAYTFQYSGTGSLNLVPLSVGAVVMRDSLFGTLRGGASLNFLFGSFEQRTVNSFTDVNFSNTQQIENSNMSGVGITLGAAYSTRQGLLAPTDQLTVGAAYTSSVSMRAERERVGFTSTGEDTTLFATGSERVVVPESFSAGLAYRGNESYLVSADVSLQNWSSFEYFGDDVSYRRNALRVGVGGEWTPSLDVRDGFFRRLTYRAGAYSHQTNLRLNNTGINELGVTAGFGIPLGDFSSRLDVNFEYALRGTTDAGLIRDNIFRFSVSLNAGELWFLKRKID